MKHLVQADDACGAHVGIRLIQEQQSQFVHFSWRERMVAVLLAKPLPRNLTRQGVLVSEPRIPSQYVHLLFSLIQELCHTSSLLGWSQGNLPQINQMRCTCCITRLCVDMTEEGSGKP